MGEPKSIEGFLSPLSKYIGELYAKGINPSETNNISLDRLSARESDIRELSLIKDSLSQLIEQIEIKQVSLREHHLQEISKVNEFLKNLNPATDTKLGPIKNYSKPEIWQEVSASSTTEKNPWRLVTKNGNKDIPAVPEIVPSPENIQMSKIYVSDLFYLLAIRVADWEQLKNMKEGSLYYVDNSKNFAMRICGKFFYGNIGLIYTNERDPIKIKDCRFGDKCPNPECTYFHNPMTKRCTDVRNFIAGSWLYAPPTNAHFRGKSRSRRIGSAEYINTDLTEINKEEIDRFHMQMFHDLLISLLMKQFRGSVEPVL